MSLPTDKAGLQARRILDKLIKSQPPAYATSPVPSGPQGRSRKAYHPDDEARTQPSGNRRGVRELLAGK
jgi:hypothetical protein